MKSDSALSDFQQQQVLSESEDALVPRHFEKARQQTISDIGSQQFTAH